MHCRVTLLLAGTTELGQALRLGLGRNPGSKQRSGLVLAHTHLLSGNPFKGEEKEIFGMKGQGKFG
jgi:hypothetical protein